MLQILLAFREVHRDYMSHATPIYYNGGLGRVDARWDLPSS